MERRAAPGSRSLDVHVQPVGSEGPPEAHWHRLECVQKCTQTYVLAKREEPVTPEALLARCGFTP